MPRKQFVLESAEKLEAMELYGLSVSVGDVFEYRPPSGEEGHGEAHTAIFTSFNGEALHASDLCRAATPAGQHITREVGLDAPSNLSVCFASAETLALYRGSAPNFERGGCKNVEPCSIGLVTVLAVADDARLHCLHGAQLGMRIGNGGGERLMPAMVLEFGVPDTKARSKSASALPIGEGLFCAF